MPYATSTYHQQDGSVVTFTSRFPNVEPLGDLLPGSRHRRSRSRYRAARRRRLRRRQPRLQPRPTRSSLVPAADAGPLGLTVTEEQAQCMLDLAAGTDLSTTNEAVFAGLRMDCNVDLRNFG
jgi:hypothetical protein